MAVAVAGGHLLRETLDQAQTAPKAKMLSGCAGKREIQFFPPADSDKHVHIRSAFR